MRKVDVAVASGSLFALLLASPAIHAQTAIRSLTGIIEGHEIGGVTIDQIGNVYAADFGASAEVLTRLFQQDWRSAARSGALAEQRS